MRTLLLFLSLTGLSAADLQKLTFSDGSVKIGYVDVRTGVLTLHNGFTVAIEIDRIIRRDPATLPLKAPEIPAPEIPAPAQPVKLHSPVREAIPAPLEAPGSDRVQS